MTDRQLCHCAALAVLFITTMKTNVMLAEDNRGIVDVGSRRELFVDRFLIDRMGNTTLKLHEPKLAPETPKPADTVPYFQKARWQLHFNYRYLYDEKIKLL